jgi:hypothetical protein
MKKLFIAILVAILVSGTLQSIAQQHRCGTDEYLNYLIALDPGIAAIIHQQNNEIAIAARQYENIDLGTANKTTASGTIPVVFHVVLTKAQIDQIGGVQKIMQRAINQLEVLNADYNTRNSDTTNTPQVFKPLRGNPQITFALARRTPTGKSTSGVEIREITNDAGFSINSGAEKRTSSGGLDAWDVKKYLNVWIIKISTADILGYALHPARASAGGRPDEAGVTLNYGAFGKKTSLSDNSYFIPNIDRGRTMTHEVGHFFTLDHIWGNTQVGSGTCNDDDGVDDTPKQLDANYGCPTFPKANCTGSTGGEMFMNYMDYVNDACMNMFSKGQVNRINSQLSNAFYKDLFNQPSLVEWPTVISSIDSETPFDVYPNPAISNINVSGKDIKAVSIINMMGQVIKTLSSPTPQDVISLDVSNVARGVYLIQATTQEGTEMRKITLQ